MNKKVVVCSEKKMYKIQDSPPSFINGTCFSFTRVSLFFINTQMKFLLLLLNGEEYFYDDIF